MKKKLFTIFPLLAITLAATIITLAQTSHSNLILAEQFREKSDWENALIYFTKAIDANEANGDPLVGALTYAHRAQAYFNLGNYDKAILDCDKSIQIKSDIAAVYHFRASSLRQKGRVDEAITDFTHAIQLDSGFAGSYTSRGIAYSNKGNYDLAISDYTKAIELEPNESEGYILRGMEYRMKGDLDQALIDFDSAIRIDPKAEPAYMGRGNVLLHKREYDKAIINYNKVLQLNPNSKDAYQFRGLTYAEMGSYDFAINDYDAAIKIDPDFANAYSARGEAYSKKGEYSKAISDYKKKLSLRPNDIGSYYPLAWINLYLGDGSAAYDNAIHFLERNGLKGNSAPYSILAGYFGLRKSNKPADAKIFLTTWIRNVSSNSWPGQIMRYLQGDLTEDQLLALAVDKDKLTEAHAYIGEIQLLTGNNSAARTHFSWVKDNGNKTFSEYNLALAELNRLDPPTPVRN